MKKQVEVLGVWFDCITKKDLCSSFVRMLEGRKKEYIVTPNPEIIELSVKDIGYRRVLNGASLCLADGVGIIYAARLLNASPIKRIPGIEAGEMLMCLLARRKKESAFFLGAEKGVAEKAAENMSKKHSGLNVSGTHHGFFNVKNEENDSVVRKINDSGASVLFVCMGAPRQEKWIAENIGKLKNVKIALALGGALDVYAGKVQRAPQLWRQTNLEWLWRTFLIPGRLKKVVPLTAFSGRVLAESLIKRKNNNRT